MSIKVKYVVANNSIHAKEPKQATIPQIMICLQQKQRHCFHVDCYACFAQVENGNSFWIFWKDLSKIKSSERVVY